MIQQILIGAIFLGAAGYLARMAFRSFQAKRQCATGCGKCAEGEVEKIEKQLTNSQ